MKRQSSFKFDAHSTGNSLIGRLPEKSPTDLRSCKLFIDFQLQRALQVSVAISIDIRSKGPVELRVDCRGEEISLIFPLAGNGVQNEMRSVEVSCPGRCRIV